jgi:hypothetical protein
LGQLITTSLDWVGAIIVVIAWICIMVTAFQKSVLWGLGVLLFSGIIGPLFVLMNWKQTSYWFFFGLVGFLIMYIF